MKDKAREFWLNTMYDEIWETEPSEFHHHVIEYSAYEALQEKIKELEKDHTLSYLLGTEEYKDQIKALMQDALKLVEIIRMSCEINSNESLKKRSRDSLSKWTEKHGGGE